jgi:hypothetical protein
MTRAPAWRRGPDAAARRVGGCPSRAEAALERWTAIRETVPEVTRGESKRLEEGGAAIERGPAITAHFRKLEGVDDEDLATYLTVLRFLVDREE